MTLFVWCLLGIMVLIIGALIYGVVLETEELENEREQLDIALVKLLKEGEKDEGKKDD